MNIPIFKNTIMKKHENLKGKYPVVCARCSTMFFLTVIGFSDVEHSHGECERCVSLASTPEGEFLRLRANRDQKEVEQKQYVNNLYELDKNCLDYKEQRHYLKIRINMLQMSIDEITQILQEKFNKGI